MNYETTLATVRGISEGTAPTGRKLFTIPIREFSAAPAPRERLPDPITALVTPRGTGVVRVTAPLTEEKINTALVQRKAKFIP